MAVFVATRSEANATVVELHDQLDNLWAQYLQQLETYQAAQVALQEKLSAAFFSLAQANFSKVSGRRYGRDYYDERAVASVRVRVQQPTTQKAEHNDALTLDEWTLVQKQAPVKDANKLSQDLENLDLEKVQDSKLAAADDASQLDNDGNHVPEGLDSPPPNQDTETESAEQSSQSEKNNTHVPMVDSAKDEDFEEQIPTDPLRSFAGGVLIPLQLRKTRDAFASIFQTSDTSAGESPDCPIVQAVVAARRMRQMEADIRRMRKAIRKAEMSSGEK
jgi:hypothetical protein